MRSDSFLAGMTTARPPRGDMAAILVALLAADGLRWIVRYGEHRFKPCHLQDLPDRGARCGQFEVTAGLTRLTVTGKKNVHPGRVAEIYPRQVNNQAHRATSG